MLIQQFKTSDAHFAADFKKLLHYSPAEDEQLLARVKKILFDVKTQGDSSLIQATQNFDQLAVEKIDALKLSQNELHSALKTISTAQRDALQVSIERIFKFHQAQKNANSGNGDGFNGEGFHYQEADGTLLAQRIVPLDRVGIYVPGGKAAYPSSVLMNAIPAQVAGVKEIVMVVPTPQGVRNPLVLAAAALLDIQEVWTIGGVQAIAALAYGTESIRAVDKIVGPGNAYVAAAKREVYGTVGIDMVAGPSEITIIADGSTNPEWLVLDLFAQAEHDENAQVILLCPDANYLARIYELIEALLPTMNRQAIIKVALQNRGALIHVKDLSEAYQLTNTIAPEHLELAMTKPEQALTHIQHAGAIFVGSYTSESIGDYCAGTNHVLPTARSARFCSALGVYDFQKRTSLIRLSENAADQLADIAYEVAMAEGLQAHALAAMARKRKA